MAIIWAVKWENLGGEHMVFTVKFFEIHYMFEKFHNKLLGKKCSMKEILIHCWL